MKTLLSLALFLVGAIVTVNATSDSTTSAPAKGTQFRLVFKGYDGDPKKDKVEKFSFQVDTVDLRQPSEFLKLGEIIPHTNLKLATFTFKEAFNPKIGEKEDVSELTVVNVKTGQSAVLKYNQVTDVSALNPPAK